LIREEEHTDANGTYFGSLSYSYCLTGNGDLVVINRGSKFEWKPYDPYSTHGLYQGGSYFNPMKDEDIRLFDYKALWLTEKRTPSNWKEGNRNSRYDPTTDTEHPDRECLVEYPGEGITIMLERLLHGGNITYRCENNEPTQSQIDEHREKLKAQDFVEGYAFTDDEISLLVQYETAKQAARNNLTNNEPDRRKELALAAVRKKYKQQYPKRPLPPDFELERIYYKVVDKQ
jgi:hypothetical protein